MSDWLKPPPGGEGAEPPAAGKPLAPAKVTAPSRTEDLQAELKKPLPKLNLQERLPVPPEISFSNPEQGVKSRIQILPWGDNTIVFLEDQVKIFDALGQELEDFKSVGKGASIDWPAIGKRLKKTKLYYRDATDAAGINYLNLPSQLLQKAAEEKFRHYGSSVTFDQFGVTALKMQNVKTEIVANGKYIIFYSKEGAYVAFVTQNEQGTSLPPRNWKRISIGDSIPDDLAPFIGRVEKGHAYTHKKLNDTYFARISQEAVQIVTSDTGEPIFEDKLAGVGSNICVDPTNPSVVYYCSSSPNEVLRLDTSGSSASWKTRTMKFSEGKSGLSGVTNIEIDPTGHFLLLEQQEDEMDPYNGRNILSTKSKTALFSKDSLEPLASKDRILHAQFDEGGTTVRGVYSGAKLASLTGNYDEVAQAMDKKRASRLRQAIRAPAGKKGAPAKPDRFKHLIPVRDELIGVFKLMLDGISDRNDLQNVYNVLSQRIRVFRSQNLSEPEITFLADSVKALIQTKEKELAGDTVRNIMVRIRAQLAAGLSLASILSLRPEIEEVESLRPLVEPSLHEEIRTLVDEFHEKSAELFSERGAETMHTLEEFMRGVEAELQQIDSMLVFEEWLDSRRYQLYGRLGTLDRECPTEAHDVHKKIMEARRRLDDLAEAYETKFKKEYAEVREKAVERTEEVIHTIEHDIEQFIKRLRDKAFKKREDAETFIQTSESKAYLEGAIEALRTKNPENARQLEQHFRIQLINLLTEIERGAFVKISATGQQMAMFGKVLFPVWEAKTQKTPHRKADLIFIPDEKTKGPGVRPDNILGDIGFSVKNSRNATEFVRLFQGWDDENDWRLGMRSLKGSPIVPSYVSGTEYKKFQKLYLDWIQGERSQLRKQLQVKLAAIHAHYAKRPKKKKDEPRPEDDPEWKKLYLDLLEDYGKFCSENFIALLRRTDEIREAPEPETTNGKGYVPEWQNHWVLDPHTEGYLEQMAEICEMQLGLQEGLLNLKGHAGAGKDVLVKMFCERTRRPYFAIDCTKWTTEYEFSEDIVLQSVDGATQTVSVPSVVLNAITTPGAVMYFNEINAMTEQAQIFLHALMDEKRSITLKTRSGHTIHADPSVLLIGSMNPGYPGTFAPQFATRSRMVSLDIEYPPLFREKDAADTNPNPPYNVSEALRIARGVDSFADLTYDPNLSRNTFAQMWDAYVNGIKTGAPALTPTQEFDMNVILALIEFSADLRRHFIARFEQTAAARGPNALPVTQPVTSREMRRCAYQLSKIPPADKVGKNPEQTARDLFERFFLSHIDRLEDRVKIRNSMKSWTAKKRQTP